jgi:hypothetical protein
MEKKIYKFRLIYMKKVIFALGVLLPIISISQSQVVFKIKSKEFNFSIPNLKNGQYGLAGGVEGVSGAILYKVGDIEHIIQNSADSLSPALHFIKQGEGDWEFENYYDEGSVTGAFRNYSFIDTLGTIAFASHGSEAMKPWPYGDLLIVKTNGKKLQWSKITSDKSFYHSVGTGDLNGDGLVDIVGLHMGSNTNVWENWNGISSLDPWLQDKDSKFSRSRTIATDSNWSKNPVAGGAVLVGDIDKDGTPEIIKADYGNSGNLPFLRYSFAIFKKNKELNKYYYYKSPDNLGLFENKQQGASSIKSADFNKDGNIDLAIASEGYPTNYIQIWLGNGKGGFDPNQILSYNDTARGFPDSSNTYREFEIIDLEYDGWPDIVVHPFHYGSKFRINPKPFDNITNPKGWFGNGIKLNHSIWKNNSGRFNQLENKIQFDSIYPAFMKGFQINDQLRFFGFESKYTPSTPNKFIIYDVSINFCRNLIKPLFNTIKFSFCTGDSLKLTVTNINKGDSLKWYYGTKSDLTNVSNKTFTDSSKLFVIRKDSVGCVISTDTVSILKYAIPNAPNISRDTANNLVSNSIIGNVWFKDGTVLTDTTQKIKPTSPGSYTVKSTQDGCTSKASAAYFYMVTDVINLSSDEYIKLAPNPFINQLNFDFLVKGYQKLNLEVFDIASGAKVASQLNLTPGMPIYLSQLSAGTYVIKVTSTDNKISYQFKMVKL